MLPGCWGETPEFDKSSLHTPESLVDEFVLLYKRLPGRSSDKVRTQVAEAEKKRSSLPDVDAPSGKSARKEEQAKKKMAEDTETLENLLIRLEERLGALPGMSRSEAAKKAVAAVEKSTEIKDDDRKTITDRLNRL